jgi:hypothetical protein
MAAHGDWQPIATALKDEAVLFIVWNGHEVTCAARWEGGFADWMHDWMDSKPTHWMPLPLPPETEG